MIVNQKYTRIATLELKALLYQKLGKQRADIYFNLLNKLFSLQISKSNFDKFCIRAIGRENLPLHNRLISSILKNSVQAKLPPPTVKKFANSLNVKVTKIPQRNNLQSLYGDAFPLTPTKSRSPRAHKFKDRFSPLGPNGSNRPNRSNGPNGSKVHHEIHQSPTELYSLTSKPPVEGISVESGEEVVSASPGIQSKSLVTAPLGISLNIGPARKTLSHNSVCGSRPVTQTCQESFELPDSGYLRSRLKQKLEGERLSISENCANLINVGLDSYLKRLIEPCVGIARSRLTQMAPPGLYRQRPKISTVSGLDFMVRLQTDPCRLGGDWSTQLEKVYLSTIAE